MTSLVVSNLFTWCLEVLVLVTGAGLAVRLLTHPQARLRFWQAVIVASLLLPLAAPWKHPAPIVAPQGPGVSISVTGPADVADPRQPLFSSLHLLEFLAAGAALRLLWLCIGGYRLRHLRKQAVPLDPVFSSVHARWYESASIDGPVTFGWLRPSILLPRNLRELPQNLRDVIACHELVHVSRRDWIFVIAEELLRSVFWFHPAIWYALGQVQLAREHAVDLETVNLTQDRQSYLDALLAVAAYKLQPGVAPVIAPATLFLKKRQLASRLAALVKKETTMSVPRVFARITAAISAASAAAVLAVWMFPLVSPAQVVADDPGVTVDAGAKLLHRTPVRYPVGTATGSVLVEATLNNKGDVTDARVLSGPDELRKPVLASVLDWHYSADPAPPPTVRITIQFNRAPGGAATSAGVAVRGVGRGVIGPTVKGGLPADSVNWTGPITDIRYVGIGPELQQQIENKLPVHKGDLYNKDAFFRTLQALDSVDEHLNATVQIARDGGPVTLVIALSAGRSMAPPPPPPPPPAPPVAGAGPIIRVGGNVQAQNLITKVTPAYPPLAKQARIQGTVSLSVTINPDGTVSNLELISGHPLLVESAIEAVRQWVYKPTLLNGSPVTVLTQVDVNYTLSQ